MTKTLSLLLVFALMLSVLVIPAAAAMPDENTANPVAIVVCPDCGDPARTYGTTSGIKDTELFRCTEFSGTHKHRRSYTTTIYECSICGNFSRTVYANYETCLQSGVIFYD